MNETPKRIVWLICPQCNVREAVQPHTKFVGCPRCGEARHAMNEDGQAIVFWSAQNDITDWSSPPSARHP